jgi:hypothetical protein
LRRLSFQFDGLFLVVPCIVFDDAVVERLKLFDVLGYAFSCDSVVYLNDDFERDALIL